MKLIIAAFIAFSCAGAFALECDGAVKNAMTDAGNLNEALTLNPGLPTIVVYKELEGIRFRNSEVRATCIQESEARSLFCRSSLSLTANRFNLLIEGDRPFSELRVLMQSNQEILDSINSFCFH